MGLYSLGRRLVGLHLPALMVGVALLLALAAACGEGDTPTPLVIEKQVVVEKEVVKEVPKEVVVEKEVEKEVVKEVPVVVVVTPTMAPTPTPAAFPVVIIDSNGDEVVFEEPPQRIVAMDSAVVEFLYAIGEGHRIVGVHDFVSYPPEADDIPRIGSAFNINYEKVLEREPDLVSHFQDSAIPDLKKLGPKVLYMETPATLSGISDQIRMWGRITGSVEAAERVVTDVESRIQVVLDKLSVLQEGPRVFHDDSLLYTRGPDTILGEVYTLLKAKNIAHDISGYKQLSPEVVVERDPEVIITTFPPRVPEFMDDPAFKGVTAIKEDRVEVVQPDGLVSVFGTRFVEGIELLAHLLHPDLFPENPQESRAK